MTVNKHTILGFVGQDPEIRQNSKGNPFGRFSVATSESWKNQTGEWQERTDWHTIIVNGYLADKAKKDLKKGSRVYVEGKSRKRKWVNDQGIEQWVTEVHADQLIPLNATGDASQQANPSQSQPQQQQQQQQPMQQRQRQQQQSQKQQPQVPQQDGWMNNPDF